MSQSAIELIKSVDTVEDKFGGEMEELDTVEYNYQEYPCESFVFKNVEFRRDKYVGKGSFSYCFSYRHSLEGQKLLVAKVSTIFDIKNRCPTNESVRKEVWDKEVDILRSLKHENIVQIYATKEVCCLM